MIFKTLKKTDTLYWIYGLIRYFFFYVLFVLNQKLPEKTAMLCNLIALVILLII